MKSLHACISRPDPYTAPSPVSRGTAVAGQLIPLPSCISRPSLCRADRMMPTQVRARCPAHALRCHGGTRARAVLAPLVAEMGEGIRRVVDAHRLTAAFA